MNSTIYCDKEYFWQNFELGIELHIAGGFIYDSLYSLDKMSHFNNEEECFDILYKMAVGIERLEKISIILKEYSDDTAQADFEKSLISHNHVDLMKRIDKSNVSNLGKIHFKFLELLRDFYKTTHYDHYNLTSTSILNKGADSLLEFIESGLKIKLKGVFTFSKAIDLRVKNFIGKTASKIYLTLYQIIYTEAGHKNMFTYEIRSDSKAYKVFMRKDYNFVSERILKNEIFAYLLKESSSGFMNFINSIDAVNFQNYDTYELFLTLIDRSEFPFVIDELESIYEDEISKEVRSERYELMSTLGDYGLAFEDLDEDSFDNDMES